MKLHRAISGRFYLALTWLVVLVFGLVPPIWAVAATPEATPDPGPLVRICTDENLDQIQVGTQIGYQILNLATGGVISTVYGTLAQPPAQTLIAARPIGVAVGSAGVFTGSVAIRPVWPPAGVAGATNHALVDGRPYRAELEVKNVNGKLSVINVIHLEDYLLGVVPKEMPSNFHPEALKAQAVAARSYAIYQIKGGKYRNRGYDLVDGTDSQVYGGVKAEDPRASQAVQATRGQVLTFGGEVINAFFHASSGGHTENSENVWSSAVPYLRGVPDFDQDSPRYRWTRTFTGQELASKFGAAGYPVGTFYRMVPEGLVGVSGRWTTLAVEGSAGRHVLKGTQIRTILGLNSTRFQIVEKDSRSTDVKVSAGFSQPLLVQGSASKRSIPVSSLQVRSAGKVVRAGELGLSLLGRNSTAGGLELQGGGWGHGIGLSQWGAKALAEKGNTYQQILAHYYRGTALNPSSAYALAGAK